MTVDQNQASVESCRTCGQLLDISAMAPLTVAACPVCSTSTVVLRRLGPFLLERLIGHGGMGAVYQAHDIALKRSLAVKVLHRSWSHDANLTVQFEHEAAMTARINHPNVVRVYSTGTSHGMFYIAMELVNHGSLDSWMRSVTRIPEEELLEVAIQVTEGLQSAYRAGLIHRDIKPANILFAENRLAKIVDFGLALHSNENHKSTGEVWGTPDYIAPEALAAKHEDFRSDMYAMGATLWHALTGNPPHQTDSTSIAELLEIKRQTVDLGAVAPWLSPLTVATLNRTLAFAPADRYPDYESLLFDLRHALDGIYADTERPRLSKKKKPLSWKALATAGALLVSLAGVGVWKIKHREVPRTFTPGETSVSDETRLHNANQLLASGQPEQIEQAAQLLELILRVPDLSPRLNAWTKVSLATAYSLQGRWALRSPILQSLSMIDIAGEPELTAFLRGLPAVAPGTKWRQEPDKARDALQQIWTGLYFIWKKDFVAAKSPLEAAKSFDSTGWGESEVVTLLPLAKKILEDITSLSSLEIRVALLAQRKDYAAATKEIEAFVRGGITTGPVRARAQELLAQIRSGPPRPEALAQSKPQTPAAPPATSAKAPSAESQAPVATPPKPDPIALQRFESVRRDTSEMVRQYRFQAATKKIGEFLGDFPSEANRANILLHQIRACTLFFQWSIGEVQRAPGILPFPTLKNGAVFPARPVRANEDSLLLQTENGGSTNLKWDEISPAFLLTLANNRLATLTAPIPRAELLWYAGNYQIVLGSVEKGVATLKQATELNPGYTNALKALTE